MKRGALQHVSALAEVARRTYYHENGQHHEYQREHPCKYSLALIIAAPVLMRMRGHACAHAELLESVLHTLKQVQGLQGEGSSPRSAADMLPIVIDIFNLHHRDCRSMSTQQLHK